MSEAPPPPPKVYEPGDPDPLRDGLFEGFWRHLPSPREVVGVVAGIAASPDAPDAVRLAAAKALMPDA